MKKHFFLLLALGLIVSACNEPAGRGTSALDRLKQERSDNAAIEAKIDELLSAMTLEEKIGQMTQITNSQIVTKSNWGNGSDLIIEMTIDTAKLGVMIRKYHVVSFLN